MKRQKFGAGDVAILDGKYKVRIMDCIYDDEEGEWYYEVFLIGAPSYLPTREVKQGRLKNI